MHNKYLIFLIFLIENLIFKGIFKGSGYLAVYYFK